MSVGKKWLANSLQIHLEYINTWFFKHFHTHYKFYVQYIYCIYEHNWNISILAVYAKTYFVLQLSCLKSCLKINECQRKHALRSSLFYYVIHYSLSLVLFAPSARIRRKSTFLYLDFRTFFSKSSFRLHQSKERPHISEIRGQHVIIFSKRTHNHQKRVARLCPDRFL